MNREERLNLLEKWLKEPESNFSINELYTLLSLFQGNDSDNILEEHFQSSYNDADNSTPVLDPLLKKSIYDAISLRIDKIESDRRRKFRFRRLADRAIKIAAILSVPLILLSLYLILNDNSKNLMRFIDADYSIVEYFSPPGTRTHIVLPDSSVVWLNGNSKLKLSSNFGVKKREVSLEGEAFFSVTKNENNPFFVDTEKMKIKVYGTNFNIAAYSDDDIIETVLVSGEVSILYNDFLFEKEFFVKPSQKVSFDKSSSIISAEEVSTEAYLSWRDGKIIFKDHSISDVASILGKWFNVPIDYDKSLENQKFTATLDNKSLDQILLYISYSSPIEYTYRENTIYLYPKSK